MPSSELEAFRPFPFFPRLGWSVASIDFRRLCSRNHTRAWAGLKMRCAQYSNCGRRPRGPASCEAGHQLLALWSWGRRSSWARSF